MYKFKQAVHFPGKKGERDENGHLLPDEPGHTFKHGDVCKVPKAVEEHPYFQGLLKDGLVVEAKPEAPKESLEERNIRLAAKLAADAKPAEAEEADESSDEEEESHEEHKKHKKGKKHKE